MSTDVSSSIGGNFATRYLTRVLSERLPRKVKRMLYVSSVIGMVIQRDKPDMAMVERINKVMHLAYRTSSLLFPVYIGSVIWKNLCGKTVQLEQGPVEITHLPIHAMQEIDLWRTGVFFSRNAPAWLHYGSENLMTTDVHDALVCLDTMPA